MYVIFSERSRDVEQIMEIFNEKNGVPLWGKAERTFRRVRRGGAVQLAPGIRVAACPKFERDRRERRQSGR